MTQTVIEPTHEKQGRTVYFCNDCEYTYDSDFVAPLGHTLSKELHAPTCTSEGYTYNFCRCGYHFNSDQVAPLEHTFTQEFHAPTCTEQGYTSNTCKCGYSYASDIVPPTGHVMTVSAEVAPTCDAEGYKAGDCTLCGEHYTYDIKAPLGHALTVERGYVSLNNGLAESRYTCSRCELDHAADFLFYSDVYQGAYVENTQILCKGIDVSKWNHNIDASGNYLPLDWELIKDAGFEFVILRAGYMGSGNVFVDDPVFEMNYRDAKAAGLGVGAYIYSYAYSIEDARAEAAAMVEVLAGKQFEYPIYFDIEYSDAKITEKGLTPEIITSICKEFISIMQDNGYFTALYTNQKWLTEHFISSEVTALFDIWYARYKYLKPTDGTTPVPVVNEDTWNTDKFGAQMAMWQFSETGTIEGIQANDGKNTPIYFDLNYCYKDYPTLIKHYGLNGFPNTKDLSHLDKEV